ncbi:MAG: hypothetical protein AB1Z66_12490 [Candidatus Limnocylindrales bacterium]
MSARGTRLSHDTSIPMTLRQGDILLVAVPGIPDGARQQPRTGRIVLAEGEATGHAHAIHEPDARTFVHAGVRYLLTRSRAQLVHEEHAPIDVPPGRWRVVQQREYEPAAGHYQSWRPVLD